MAVKSTPNNFPPFFPLFYQDIDEEIAIRVTPVVKLAFNFYKAYCGYYLFNFIAATMAWIVVGEYAQAGTGFLFSLIDLILIIPLMYVFWFRQLYMAVKRDREPYNGPASRFNFILFFVVSAISFILLLLNALGLSNYSPGLYIGIRYMSCNCGVPILITGVIMVVCGLFAGLLVALEALIIQRVRQIYLTAQTAVTSPSQKELPPGHI